MEVGQLDLISVLTTEKRQNIRNVRKSTGFVSIVTGIPWRNFSV